MIKIQQKKIFLINSIIISSKQKKFQKVQQSMTEVSIKGNYLELAAIRIFTMILIKNVKDYWKILIKIKEEITIWQLKQVINKGNEI